jgi:hypothetical protein
MGAGAMSSKRLAVDGGQHGHQSKGALFVAFVGQPHRLAGPPLSRLISLVSKRAPFDSQLRLKTG